MLFMQLFNLINYDNETILFMQLFNLINYDNETMLFMLLIQLYQLWQRDFEPTVVATVEPNSSNLIDTSMIKY